MIRKIVLDTNFLLAAYQFELDIMYALDEAADFEYSLFVVDKTVAEIEKIESEQKGKNKEAAKWALQILEENEISVVESLSETYADDVLVDLGKEGYIVATLDKGLKSRLKKVDATIALIRQKKRVSFINEKLK